ncbi:heparanase-like protein 1 [Ananas comosus]|uniref:Heparanase-like protein 1 n=1 Tax=Ananas comosus TaxID=4615 RepID=A0A6P5FTK1_ANACO|nr:heparanase-like protein 1 [Ananas comosus]
MGLKGAFLLLFSVLCTISLSLGDDVTVTVRSVTTIGRTDDNLVCATLDWWPKEKCNYGVCPWTNASIIDMDLSNPALVNAIKAFNPLRLRLGGSLQDQIIYKTGKYYPRCQSFRLDPKSLFGFTSGCLTMDRWDELNQFFNETGAVITFGLNALIGRRRASKDGLYVGNMNPTNAYNLMKYSLSKGYKIDSWELGNELSAGGVSARVNGVQYGEDLIRLKELMNRLYAKEANPPKLMAPGGFFDAKWFADMLQTSGPNVVDVVSHHIYNLGAGVDKDLIYKMQDPYFLSEVAETYKDLEVTIRDYGPWSSPWVSESGGAFNSGGKDVSDAFVDSFWYLDQLGMVSTFGHKVFCRQALIGGNYALLNTTTFAPFPDYFSALLWHRLMGSRVLGTSHNGSPYLRSYTHCSKGKSGVTVLLINLSNSTSFDVSVVGDMNLYPPVVTQSIESSSTSASSNGGQGGQREEYHLTPQGGDLKSKVMLLNGTPLTVGSNGEIPNLSPSVADGSAPVHVAPLSIVFARFKDFKAPACS